MASIETFWTTNGTGSTLLIEPTPGDAVTKPYTILPGSDGVDYTNAQVWIDAGLLFQDAMLDPVTGQFPDRPDFATATVADFTVWHSRHQVDFILERGTQALSPPPPPAPAPVPPGTLTVTYFTFTDGPTFVLGQDGRRVYNVEALSFGDIATMPLIDQQALAELPVFQARAEDLLVRPLPGETVADVRAEMVARVNAVIADIEASTNYQAVDRDRFLQGFLYDGNLRVELYPHLFIEQLSLYKLRLNTMALFSEGRIGEFLSDLAERFARLKSYHDVTPEEPTTAGLINGVNALDAGTTMRNGLGVFIEMESQLFQIALARAYLTATGTLIEPIKGKLFSTQSLLDEAVNTVGGGFQDYATFLTGQATDIYGRITAGTSKQRFLDGPNLIFVLQTFSNYEAEAEAQIKSEDLNQQTKILQDYSELQKLLNDTLTEFKPEADFENEDSPPEELAFLNLTIVAELTEEQKRIASMFDTVASAGAGTSYHPIEAEMQPEEPGLFRPTVEIATDGTLNRHTKSIWDALAVSVGESTKLISQDSQIQMDAINKLSQQKNRHYELGSNVLNKVTELLRELTS
jgi:hypothetical protein